MNTAIRLYIPITGTPVELRKRLKIDTEKAAFYVDDPSDAQLDYLLSKSLITQEAVDDIRLFRDSPPLLGGGLKEVEA
jgi:hypothetical protein